MRTYKVVLGTRRYTTEKVEIVQARSAEEAMNIAMNKHKGMRWAHCVTRKER